MPAAAQIVKEIYTYVTQTLPPTARLQLAAMILNGLTDLAPLVVDDSDTWTEQDKFELAAFSLKHAVALFPEDEEIVS